MGLTNHLPTGMILQVVPERGICYNPSILSNPEVWISFWACTAASPSALAYQRQMHSIPRTLVGETKYAHRYTKFRIWSRSCMSSKVYPATFLRVLSRRRVGTLRTRCFFFVSFNGLFAKSFSWLEWAESLANNSLFKKAILDRGWY